MEVKNGFRCKEKRTKNRTKRRTKRTKRRKNEEKNEDELTAIEGAQSISSKENEGSLVLLC